MEEKKLFELPSIEIIFLGEEDEILTVSTGGIIGWEDYNESY